MTTAQHPSERAALLVDSSGPQLARLSSVRGTAGADRERGRLWGMFAPLSRERLRSLYPVTIFCITSALLFADQNLMAPNLTDIAKNFGFDESERDKYLGGYIGAAFYLFGAPAAIIFGYLSNYVSRRLLFVVAVLLGEGPCILTIFVTRYWQLFLLRLLTGISIGGCLPLIFSLLSDMYEHEQRSLVSAVVQVAVGMGIAAGQGVAGYVGPWLGWRWPFVIVAVPAILCAGIMYVTTEEPERGSTERAFQVESMKAHRHQVATDGYPDGQGNAARGNNAQGNTAQANRVQTAYHADLDWDKMIGLASIKTNVYAIGQGLPGCLPWGMLLTFLNDYLAQEKGLAISAATSLVLGIGMGGALGVVGGGIIGQYLYNRSPRTMPMFIGCCTVLGTFPMWYLIKGAVRAHYTFAFGCSVFAGMLSSTVGPNVRAMIMNVNEPETRGVALALQTTLDDLGKGLGPAVVALMISGLGRESAFFWATAGWIPCGVLLMMCGKHLEDDEAAMQMRLSRTLSGH